jgi:hypothetical protein
MKKRYMVLILIIGFGAIFGFLIHDASAPAPRNTDKIAENALVPEAAPAQKDDLIIVDSPLPRSVVASPIVVKGRARGTWFFEGSFPIELTDANGVVLAKVPATALDAWMTDEYVRFSASISYELPSTATSRQGYLILRKDNPSREAKFDNALTLPVTL